MIRQCSILMCWWKEVTTSDLYLKRLYYKKEQYQKPAESEGVSGTNVRSPLVQLKTQNILLIFGFSSAEIPPSSERERDVSIQMVHDVWPHI